ncbi:hypothetical protein SFUMM280S_03484 [Streptomyces fumanus]
MAAVVGSTSTPVICTGVAVRIGAKPMKLPLPEPGSRTRPPTKPRPRTAPQIERTRSASV